jgi:D-alanyl-D-alanine carboxypeptidase (penicillin-binding protein 5/6)
MLVNTRKALMGAIAFFCAAFAAAAPPLNVTADSAVIIEAQSGKILWAKDADTPRYPASTTKIMTAMLLIEHCQPTDVITAPEGVDKVEGASLHLVPGEKMTVQEMLYGLLLRSANDGCVAVATHISGSVPAFVALMNERAKQLGCKNTHFDNPNGLNDDNHTISAYDMALIARAAMHYEQFRAIVGIRRHEITRSVNMQDRFLVSKNKYLSIDPSADGIKTGWTREAGQCYVGSATRNGYRVITVVFHATDWKTDNGMMMDWAFQNHDRELVLQTGATVAEVSVNGGAAPRVAATVPEDIYHVYDKTSPCRPAISFQLYKNVQAPVTKGQQLGLITVTDADGWVEQLPLIALAPTPKGASIMGAGFLSIFFFIGIMGSGAFILKRRLRRFAYAKNLRRKQISKTYQTRSAR